MIGNHPKRRKDKYNPYTICENDGRYYLSFKDGQGVQHEMEIQKDLFDMLNRFELDNLSILNAWDRHIEHFEQTEQSLNRRTSYKAESVEDICLMTAPYSPARSRKSPWGLGSKCRTDMPGMCFPAAAWPPKGWSASCRL